MARQSSVPARKSKTAIVAAPKKKLYRMFYILCAAGGLRFGEALGIDIKNISPDCSIIKICQKAWRGQLHDFLKNRDPEKLSNRPNRTISALVLPTVQKS